MAFEEVKVLSEREKSTVCLIREEGGEQLFIRKTLKGKHPVYTELQKLKHPFLPELYEVHVSDTDTVIIEEYIEGRTPGSMELSRKQFLNIVRELCSVLEFLHGKGIIHRDIKPSNIIIAGDGHIRLIDFDAARMPKEDMEQDTILLGTRGYAPPEQYGFAQTDERSDIYALGMTLKQLLRGSTEKTRYGKIVQKCINLNPDKRYQSVAQVRRAFFHAKRDVLCGLAALFVAVFLWNVIPGPADKQISEQSTDGDLIVLPAPEDPHWEGDTGYAVWVDVPESGGVDGSFYEWRLYKTDTADPPDPDADTWFLEGGIWGDSREDNYFQTNLGMELTENGFYYFTVRAVGDGEQYADSPYVLSDVFEYTGENAPELPAPTGLAWKVFEGSREREFYATWSNLDDYDDRDCFKVYVFDKDDNHIMSNVWTKKQIVDRGYGGIKIRTAFVTEEDNAYRFTVDVYSSRPNEYRSFISPDPIPEECYSPWYYHY